MTDASTRLGLPLIVAGQAKKELTHNEALVLIDAGIASAAESIGIAAPPVAPAPGQCWILGDAPSGSWTGQAHALAVWTEGGWRFLPAVEGMRVWLKDQLCWATRTSASWVVGDEFATRLRVGGVQVVAARQAAVPEPSGGATIDLEARSAIAALIDRLAAHGLIAASS